MKPANSTMRRWLRAARLLRGISTIVLLLGLAGFAYGVWGEKTGVIHPPGVSSTDASALSPGQSGRPELIREIASRPLRRAVRDRVAPETRPVIIEATHEVPQLPEPQVELVATCRAPSGVATAYVRRTNRPALITWTDGSKEGPFLVSEIGDGWVTLQAEDLRYTLRVAKHQPGKK